MKKLNILKSLSLSFIGLSNSTIAAEITVEWAPFVKLAAVSEQSLINAADKVNIEFISKQRGFIKRELIKKNDTEYADLIHWQTKIDAESAGKLVYNCKVCIEYFNLMNANAKTGSGFSHYEILKSW